eukprot:scaffold68994_cov28-Tisochrysis_lutea.AAC.9
MRLSACCASSAMRAALKWLIVQPSSPGHMSTYDHFAYIEAIGKQGIKVSVQCRLHACIRRNAQLDKLALHILPPSRIAVDPVHVQVGQNSNWFEGGPSTHHALFPRWWRRKWRKQLGNRSIAHRGVIVPSGQIIREMIQVRILVHQPLLDQFPVLRVTIVFVQRLRVLVRDRRRDNSARHSRRHEQLRLPAPYQVVAPIVHKL